jgi:hypothetical protein
VKLKDELRRLASVKKQELFFAFEAELPCHVKINEDEFIGVNIIPDDHFEILEAEGVWSYGRLR